MIRGRKRMRHTLPAVFNLYQHFDSLVSVSPSLSELNQQSFSGRGAKSSAFTSARNIVDFEHVISAAAADLELMDDHPTDDDDAGNGENAGESNDETNDEFSTEGTLPTRPVWVDELLASDGVRWFVTVGRFSTEKNQARLLRAFAAVHGESPNTRLLLVGYGPLRAALERQIDSLHLEGIAYLVGPYTNPFPIMAAADCFVLSSDYEGQPMVILEAATIGLPIVSVDFDSIGDALPGGGIHVVAQDDQALAEGMLAFVNGSVPPAKIDAVSYNREALDEFYRAIHAVL